MIFHKRFTQRVRSGKTRTLKAISLIIAALSAQAQADPNVTDFPHACFQLIHRLTAMCTTPWSDRERMLCACSNLLHYQTPSDGSGEGIFVCQ